MDSTDQKVIGLNPIEVTKGNRAETISSIVFQHFSSLSYSAAYLSIVT